MRHLERPYLASGLLENGEARNQHPSQRGLCGDHHGACQDPIAKDGMVRETVSTPRGVEQRDTGIGSASVCLKPVDMDLEVLLS